MSDRMKWVYRNWEGTWTKRVDVETICTWVLEPEDVMKVDD